MNEIATSHLSPFRPYKMGKMVVFFIIKLISYFKMQPKELATLGQNPPLAKLRNFNGKLIFVVITEVFAHI